MFRTGRRGSYCSLFWCAGNPPLRTSVSHSVWINYTLYLFALIWISRSVILKYALPLRAHGTLKIPRSERAIYLDRGRRLCTEVRPRYLQRSSFSPTGYLIEHLQHGRIIARSENARTDISWSLNSQTLGIAGSKTICTNSAKLSMSSSLGQSRGHVS